MPRYVALSIGLALLALSLAGCVPTPVSPSGATSPTVTPTPTATPTPATTPTPELTAAPRADYGFTFFEEAQLGHTWEQMSAELPYPVAGIAECPYFGPVDNLDPAVTYAFTDSRDITLGVSFFYSQLWPGVASYPRNAEGVGIGSTAGEVRAAYPAAIVDSMSDLGAGPIARLTVNDPASGSKYVFGFTEGSPTVDLLQWGPRAGTQWSHLCGGF
jgi:hypothetical protein